MSAPVFFKSAAGLRRWLQRNHGTAPELLVGFYRKESGRKSITYPEALDEALCFGWIDGVRKGLHADSYTIRFSPRTKRSIWSAVNIKRVGELIEAGRMAAPGLQVFQARDAERANLYSYERANCELDAAYQRQFRRRAAAWTFFQAQPPSYRRVACWYVMSARKAETRQRRLDQLIETCAAQRRIT